MKPTVYMIWAPFTGPVQFTTDHSAPAKTAQRADYTCTPLVTEHDAIVAIEQARREEREACAKICDAVSASTGYAARTLCAAAIRARGEGK